jgi:hypothetical protein
MSVFEIMESAKKREASELRSYIIDSADRIQRASNLYNTNFDELGNPITKKGQEMSRRHGWSYWEDYPYTINGLMRWVRKLRKAWKYYFRSEKQKELEAQIEFMKSDLRKLEQKVSYLEDAIYEDD